MKGRMDQWPVEHKQEAYASYRRQVSAGGTVSTDMLPSGGGGGRGGRGGGGHRGGGGGGFERINYTYECTKIARTLNRLDKLPAVIFCMSRMKCVEGAHAIKEINLLHAAPKPKPDDTEGEYAMMMWEEEDKERQEKARTIERRRQQLHREHLQRFMPELGELEAYQDINSLLMRGMAYHHAGMLPILREYVELCFQVL
mmetsp:Transcript_4354/g.9137  ORF Transcript_4354/g.9137 Transcript_4354/m.9137 type:complete len:199 (+) Transcript_4354:78-674(+)